jgi:hypothetical protein
MMRTLVAGDVNLTLRWDKPLWCAVDLTTGGRSMRLGSDRLDTIVDRLVPALDSEAYRRPVGIIDRLEVFWVLSLFEMHGSIYAARSGDERILFFQDRSASVVGGAVLSADVRRHWIAVLRSVTEITGPIRPALSWVGLCRRFTRFLQRRSWTRR